MDLNTKKRKVLFKEGVDEPHAIAVDPSKGLIFWTSWKNSEGKINRASMDGNDRMTMATPGSPLSIALDIFNERVYWADYKTKTIASVDYNGNNQRTILHSDTHIKYPYSLAIFEDKLYWTDRGQSALVCECNANGYRLISNHLLTGFEGKFAGHFTKITTCEEPCTLNYGLLPCTGYFYEPNNYGKCTLFFHHGVNTNIQSSPGGTALLYVKCDQVSLEECTASNRGNIVATTTLSSGVFSVQPTTTATSTTTTSTTTTTMPTTTTSTTTTTTTPTTITSTTAPTTTTSTTTSTTTTTPNTTSPKAKTKAKAKTNAKAKSKAKAKTNAKANAKAKAKAKSKAQAKAKAKINAKANAKAKAKAKTNGLSFGISLGVGLSLGLSFSLSLGLSLGFSFGISLCVGLGLSFGLSLGILGHVNCTYTDSWLRDTHCVPGFNDSSCEMMTISCPKKELVISTDMEEDLILLLSAQGTIYQYDLSANRKLELINNSEHAMDYWLKDSVNCTYTDFWVRVFHCGPEFNDSSCEMMTISCPKEELVMTTDMGEDPILLLSTYTTTYQYDLSANRKLELIDNLNAKRLDNYNTAFTDYWLKSS
uniref:Apple domain-containing protein n=1 Tax=Acrobeloides nanus TaxID=290746 RepID=A0A914E703_9BILA